jgi:ATP-dependent Clp protease ATP-binding subunit ClpC
MMTQVDLRLHDKDMGLELTQAAKELLADHGFDPVLGARPLRRTIQREIEDALSEKILFGELKAGEIVVVDVEGEGKEATFTFSGTPKSELADVAVVAAGATGGGSRRSGSNRNAG